ncbi:MAG: fibronectin type III domain-containing protein [Candidatus Acidiferrales bacterium]
MLKSGPRDFGSSAKWISCSLIATALLIVPGCAAPGDPIPPGAEVPVRITDLAASQSGAAILLTFTLPKESVEGRRLRQPPAIEIFREFLPQNATSTPKRAPRALAYTIPSGTVVSYAHDGQIQFADSLKPEQAAGGAVFYSVRTRTSKKKESVDSNVIGVNILRVPEAIGAATARVTPTSIELSWTPPEKDIAGGAIASVAGYRIYREEIPPEAGGGAAPSQSKSPQPRFQLLGESQTPSYSDAQFEFGHTYEYEVRSFLKFGEQEGESGDSLAVQVSPRDIFPPAAPKGLVVVPVAAAASIPAHLELSWDINSETDLAGYNVYRSGQSSAPGEKLNRDLLSSPVFRDMTAETGQRYFYRVTAVDRAGNESAPGAEVAAEIPGEESPQKP